MNGLPTDLQKLPPVALDVLRFLGTLPDGASSEDIIDGAGLSERTFGKAIRRLVTRYYVSMPVQGYYTLTTSGGEAAQLLLELAGMPTTPVLPADSAPEPESALVSEPEAPVTEATPALEPDVPVAEVVSAPEPDVPVAEAASTPVPEVPVAEAASVPVASEPEPEPASIPVPEPLVAPVAKPALAVLPPVAVSSTDAVHQRRVSIFLPRELVAHLSSRMRFGFDRPAAQGTPLLSSAHTLVRMNAPGCDIDMPEHVIEVPPSGPAGPVDFRLTPHTVGTVRISIEVFQRDEANQLKAVGGMFFDLPVGQFPTPDSAEFQTLATTLRMMPGTR